MTDAELIKRVAERLGWTHLETRNGVLFGYDPNHTGSFIPCPPWRTSVDAALGVLDEKLYLRMKWDVNGWEVSYARLDINGRDIESLPRAILEAFLEVGG